MRRSQRRAHLVVVFALAAVSRGMLASPDPLQLSPGTVLEHAFSAGGSQVFNAELATGRLYLLAVEQRGIHLVVDVRGPDGVSLAAVDSPLDRWGLEPILLHPTSTASYQVEVRAPAKGVGPGRCEIRLEEIAESDRERIAALAAMTQAGTILRREPTGSLEKILTALQEARGHFQAAGDRPGEAEAIDALAAVSHRLGKQSQAVELYREAVSRWQEMGRPERETMAWSNLGLTLWEMSDLPAADEALARGLDLARRLRLAYPEADLRNNQCLVLHARSGVQPALPCYREALALYHQLGERKGEGTALNNLGFAYFNLGEPQQAEESYKQALEIRRATGDRAGEAQALNNLAVLHRSLGEIDEALKAYGQAREILATLDDRRQEATTLNNLGVAYMAMGEAERSRLYLTRALALRRAVEDRRGEIVTLNNLGRLERRNDAADKAVTFHSQALEAARAISDARNEGISRSYLGEAMAEAGRFAEALAELDKALALLRQTGDRPNEATTLGHKGEVLAASGRVAEALPFFEQALSGLRAAGDRINEAATLTARARALRDPGETSNLESAARDAEAAIAALESLRTRLGNPELRAAFLGSRSKVYELRIDILMRLAAARPGEGFDRAAFEATEQARARSLLDTLRESGAEIRSGVDPALGAQQHDLERRLALKEDRRQVLLARGKGDQAESKALEIESEQIRAELDNLDAEIRRKNPRYADLTHPEVARTGEIQDLLDSGTLLLEYSLGRDRSYLWAVDAKGLRSFILPGREKIESAARAFHQAVSTPGGEDSRARIGRTLSGMILGPVAGELGERRLAIVPDGVLSYIPFDVLPEPGQSNPVLARHEVVQLPSGSVLAAERRELARRLPARELAIVLADPVFQSDDPRIAKSERKVSATSRSLLLNRLRFSRQEALAIAALAPPGAVTTKLDFAADRDLVLSGSLRDFRYIHFATHGVFDAERPELSALALSRVDRAGKPREGFLRLRDVYDLDLAADLVVLSGCQTALGKEIRGEGLLGLTRGFLYAGAPRVMASLWWIDDRATAALMAAFYRGLWIEGLRPAAALRKARLSLARQHRFRDPSYWGAFVLQGDWR